MDRYDKSKIWDLHRNYFQQRGLKAWFKNEIPYLGVNSLEEAKKKFDLLKFFVQSNPDLALKEIKILEIAAGSGEFAYNFLKIFESQEKFLDFKIKYFISDFSQKTIEELIASNKFEKFKNQVEFLNFNPVLDNLDLNFHLIHANYFLDQLEARVISYNPFIDEYREKYIELEEIDSKLKKIKKKITFSKVNLVEEIPYEDLLALKKTFRKNRVSTSVYSYKAKQVIERLLGNLEGDFGILLFSDFHAASRPGVDKYEPCYYAGSIAHPVNFEFLKNYFSDHNLLIFFEDPIKPLHTLVLTTKSNKFLFKIPESYKKTYFINLFFPFIARILCDLRNAILIFLFFIVLYFLMTRY